MENGPVGDARTGWGSPPSPHCTGWMLWSWLLGGGDGSVVCRPHSRYVSLLLGSRISRRGGDVGALSNSGRKNGLL